MYPRLIAFLVHFDLVISAFIVVYMILNFLCISGEKDDIWKPCGDLKEIEGELNHNVTTFSRRDVEVI